MPPHWLTLKHPHTYILLAEIFPVVAMTTVDHMDLAAGPVLPHMSVPDEDGRILVGEDHHQHHQQHPQLTKQSHQKKQLHIEKYTHQR